MNHVQVLGTHNSYHIEPSSKLLDAIRGFDPVEARNMEYSHQSLSEQLTAMGIRQLELDVYADPAGGLFSNPVGPELIGEPDPQDGMDEPGLKVHRTSITGPPVRRSSRALKKSESGRVRIRAICRCSC